MAIDRGQVRQLLKAFDFRRLFIGEFSVGLRKSEAVALGNPVMPVLDGFLR